MAPTTAQSQPQPTSGGWLDGIKNLLAGLVQQATAKMGGGSPSAPSSGIPNLPAGLQAGNSRIFGDNSQNNTFIQGAVKQYMAQQQAAHAKAQADGIAAQNRSLKKSLKSIPPVQQGQPGTGVTAPSQIQQMIQSIPQQGQISGQ